MIKSIFVKNLYNFKEDTLLDFSVSKVKSSLVHKYNKDHIGNMILIYGKNNVGKSNFLRIIDEAIDFIFEGIMRLEPYKPYQKDESSIFEMIIENSDNEIRYGFELDIENSEIIDEWLYSKLDHSIRESKIFVRSEQKYHHQLSTLYVKELKKINNRSLYLNWFSNMSTSMDVITDLLKQLKSITFISCLSQKDEKNSLIEYFSKLNDNQLYREVVNEFLRVADLDIIDIDFRDEHQENIVDFVHKSGSIFQYDELSSGTKQWLRIVLLVAMSIIEEKLFIIDGIENGLHYSLVDSLINVFKSMVEYKNTSQFIITSHQEILLDYDFISNENKIFMSLNSSTKDVEISYVTNYSLREYHLISDRYRMDAFGVNPNTSSEFSLLSLLSSNKKNNQN